jgi:hypothetical protein
VLARTPMAIGNVSKKLPIGFPEKVATSIFQGLHRSAEQLDCMPKR